MALADVLAIVAGAMLVLWGAGHLVPTRSVADSFGTISLDNRRILVMEWVAEGFAHVFVGVLVILVTLVAGISARGVHTVYAASAAILVVLAALTAATGARTPVVWFRVCPVVLTTAAALLLAAIWA